MWQKPHALPRRHFMDGLKGPPPDQAGIHRGGRCRPTGQGNPHRMQGTPGPFDTRSGERALAPAIFTYPRLFTAARRRSAAFPRIFGGACFRPPHPVPLGRMRRSRPLRYRSGRSSPAFPKERVGWSIRQWAKVWINDTPEISSFRGGTAEPGTHASNGNFSQPIAKIGFSPRHFAFRNPEAWVPDRLRASGMTKWWGSRMDKASAIGHSLRNSPVGKEKTGVCRAFSTI